jgi:NTP pyrophosphatase (non-canonical NTP hydrolase)
MTPAELAALREVNVARDKEWDPEHKITLSYRGNELAGEVGEVCEIIDQLFFAALGNKLASQIGQVCNLVKKLERQRLGLRGSRATKEQLARECADAQICLDLLAMQAGIDLAAAVREKFNATSDANGLQARMGTDCGAI